MPGASLTALFSNGTARSRRAPSRRVTRDERPLRAEQAGVHERPFGLVRLRVEVDLLDRSRSCRRRGRTGRRRGGGGSRSFCRLVSRIAASAFRRGRDGLRSRRFTVPHSVAPRTPQAMVATAIAAAPSPAADEAHALAGRGLHVDAVGGDPERLGEPVAHRLPVRRELRPLEHDGGVDVADLVPRSPRSPTTARSSAIESASFEARIRVREVLADVAEPGGAQQRVDHGVGEDVGVGVPGEARRRAGSSTPPRISGRPGANAWVSMPEAGADHLPERLHAPRAALEHARSR